jgi:hypothetical protein
VADSSAKWQKSSMPIAVIVLTAVAAADSW